MTLEQPSAYGQQPPSVGATGTGEVVRTWTDCPRAHDEHGRVIVSDMLTRQPCPTCTAHWKGVVEAARAMRKAAEQELLDPANATVPAGVLAEYVMALPLPGAAKGDR